MNAPFVTEMRRACANMYRLGWDERNGGNISYMLNNEEVAEYLDVDRAIRSIPLGFDATALVGKIFIVTGTGKYFKNVEDDPENNLGIIRIAKDGKTANLLWGYKDGGRFTSELPAHLMSHIARLTVDPENRVVIHGLLPCFPKFIVVSLIVELQISKLEIMLPLRKRETQRPFFISS